MDLPAAIVLSSLILGLVILYVSTEDRWGWKRITVYLTGALALLAAIGAIGIWWLERQEAKRDQAREERDRRQHKVKIGDPYKRVIQRQGVPDTTFVGDTLGNFIIAYRDGHNRFGDIDKVFAFTPDSTLFNIRFVGDRYTAVEYGWIPLDEVQLGTPRDSVLARLGTPCREDIAERHALWAFATEQDSVLRYVRISHGAGRVILHGWRRGLCDD